MAGDSHSYLVIMFCPQLVSVITGVFNLVSYLQPAEGVLSYLLLTYNVFVCLFYDWSCDSSVTEMARLQDE